MAFSDILVTHDGPVASVVLNRPAVGNAIRNETLAELCEALDVVTADPEVGAIVLAAEGKHFQAGADFATLERITRLPAQTVRTEVYELAQGVARRLYHCPKPTVAALQGAVMTIGCELALVCDFRVVAEDARLRDSWILLGAMPPLGGLKMLPALVGMGRAKEIALRGSAVTAEEAVRIGLATELAPRAELRERAHALALELSRLSPVAYREAKMGLHRGLNTPMEDVWQTSSFVQASLLTSDDFRERLAAVRAGKPPPPAPPQGK